MKHVHKTFTQPFIHKAYKRFDQLFFSIMSPKKKILERNENNKIS